MGWGIRFDGCSRWVHSNAYHVRTVLGCVQEAIPIRIVRPSLILVALLAAMPYAIPSVSATGCINFTHDPNGPTGTTSASPSTDGVGVVVTAQGHLIALIILPDQCQIPPHLIEHYETQASSSSNDIHILLP